jgi:superfamily I DNA/RNA helicase
MNVRGKYVNCLSTAQSEAVRHMAQSRVISAGPGTGKTLTVAALVKNLVMKGVSASSILVLTFTRSAGIEMQTRIAAICDKLVSHTMTCCTLHSWAYSIMKAFPSAFGRRTGMTVYDEVDTYDVCSELNLMMRLRLTPARIRHAIESRSCVRTVDEPEGRLLIEYQRWLEEMNAVDFCGMMKEVTLKLSDPEEPVTQWAMNKWRHVIVDEAQDMDAIQFEAVKTIAGHCNLNRSLVLVGDEDQSIYGWRGANALAMNQWSDETSVTCRLGFSCRCAKSVAACAQKLIQHNWQEDRPFDTLVAMGGEAIVRKYEDSIQEASKVTQQIQRWIAAGTAPDQIAVLSRTRWRVTETAARLAADSVPMTFVGERASMYATREGKQVLSMMRLAVNQRDALSFIRIRQALHVSDAQMNELRLRAATRGRSMFEEWRATYKHPDIEGATPWNETVHQVLQWANETFNTLQHRAVVKSLHVLSSMYRLTEPAHLLNWIDRADFADNDQEVTGVHVGTIHSAKGKEYVYVVVVGLEQGHLPHRSAEDESEERRLFFVAITRAIHTVLITYADVVYMDNIGMKRLRSSFIAETGIGDDHDAK